MEGLLNRCDCFKKKILDSSRCITGVGFMHELADVLESWTFVAEQ
jgi:hypothetical protein